MIVIEDGDLEIVRGSVTGRIALPGGDGDELAVGPDDKRRPEIFITPSQADHLVVSGPKREGIVRGMDIDEAATAGNIIFERLLDLTRPTGTVGLVTAVEIIDDDLVMRERRAPLVPLPGGGAVGRAGGDIDVEQAAGLEDGLHQGRAARPVVVVHAVHDEDGDLI